MDDQCPLPQRRSEDGKTYAGAWTVLWVGLAAWAGAFFLDLATYETFTAILTPRFWGIHLSQLMGVIASVLAAKRIR